MVFKLVSELLFVFVLLFGCFFFGLSPVVPVLLGPLGLFLFLGPTITQSSLVPVFDNLFGVAIESTGENSGSLRFLLGVGVCTVFLPVGVENRFLFIWSVRGIFP